MSQTITDAFDAHMQTLPGGIAVQFEGTPYMPQPGVPYLSCRLSSYTRQAIGCGPDGVMQESGTYQVNINWPGGEGRQPAGQVADKIVAFFPRALNLITATGQAISVLYASAAPSSDNADFLTVPVVVTWMATNP